MLRRIKNIPGNVPDPDELYGRGDLLAHLWRQLQGNNLLLLAPRRFGKTGVMHHVTGRPESPYLPIYLDLEDVDSPEEFVWRVTREIVSRQPLRKLLRDAHRLPGAIGEWVKDTVDEVEFEGARVRFKQAIRDDWATAARRMMLELEKAGPTVVFVFDELASMLDLIRRRHDVNAAQQFMAWFRSVRLQQKDKLRRHRFIVAGSTGIDLILRRLDAPDKLNDFERIYVEPIAPAHAEALVRDLAASTGLGLSDAMVARVLDLMTPHVPYFIHLLFSQLGQLPPAQRNLLTDETLADVYHRRVLGPSCKHYFDHYRGRLGRYGKPLERGAMAVLSAVADAPAGRVSASVLYDVYQRARGPRANELEFDDLIADLECDWYLALDARTNEYHFLVDLMRDWWRRWFGSPCRRRAGEE